MNEFSYDYYINLVKTINNVIPLMDFANIKSTDKSFFILRHDVEFSIEKAYEMAAIEHNVLGVSSSYFFQIRNYTYNTLAFKNIALIKKIHALGHKIGLHVNVSGCDLASNLKDFITNDVHILQNVLDLPIDRFSYHRPTCDMLALHLKIDGLINTYDEMFFHFHQDKDTAFNVNYFSDSEHKWKYGHPLSVLSKSSKKIHLLTHPYSWSKPGLDNENNFIELIQLKQTLMLKAMIAECKNCPRELL